MSKTVKVGLISRIDFGSPGFRKGLLELAFDRFRESQVDFVVIAGGLLSWKHLKNVLPRKKDEQVACLEKLTQRLAEALPRLSKDDSTKLYVMISPAYDGRIGAFVAHRLTDLRNDIRFYPKPSERFGRNSKRLAVLVPTRASWRSRYASTAVDGLLGEELRRSTQPVADVYAVGCFGVFVHRPRGESPCEYFAVPALHKLEEVTSAENQVGAVVLEINSATRVTNISFKDDVREERRLISVPTGLTDFELGVFKQLQEGPKTPGMIEEALHENRDKVIKALEKLVGIKRRNYPRVFLEEDSGRYDFDNEWLQEELRYPWDSEGVLEDRLVAFGCMHAGCVHTDYAFIVKQLPKILADEEVCCLAGVGDFIEGLKHELMLRGEVIPGMNYTDQENFGGELVAEAIGSTFRLRLEKALKSESKTLSAEEVEKLINSCLILFFYTEGNHDQWVKPLGMHPLKVFRMALVGRIKEIVTKTLTEKGLPVPKNLSELVENKAVATDSTDNICVLRSGLKVGFKHPHQGRAQTTTLRLQGSLGFMRACQVGLIANFHTAAAMTAWDPNLGQRVGLQLGTLKHRSDFEGNLAKTLDFGVGCLRVRSKNGRILETETMFVIEGSGEQLVSDKFVADLRKKLGMS